MEVGAVGGVEEEDVMNWSADRRVEWVKGQFRNDNNNNDETGNDNDNNDEEEGQPARFIRQYLKEQHSELDAIDWAKNEGNEWKGLYTESVKRPSISNSTPMQGLSLTERLEEEGLIGSWGSGEDSEDSKN